MIDFSSPIPRFLFAMWLFAAPGFSQGSTVLVLGDSISAAYGLENPVLGWVGLLAEKLKSTGKSAEIVNASISGEISAGGLARIDGLLARHRPSLLILELGANDGLRGLPPTMMQANLGEIMARAKRLGVKILLLGMRIPPNYGKRYNEMFESVFPALAREQGAAFVPFLMEGVGGVSRYLQADGLHPNAEAQPVLMRQVWERLEPLL
ncbi:MAG: arylesterase [Methylococcaceae bacterium]|nr:arylesterase [Methylococcaceae bacterium]